MAWKIRLKTEIHDFPTNLLHDINLRGGGSAGFMSLVITHCQRAIFPSFFFFFLKSDALTFYKPLNYNFFYLISHNDVQEKSVENCRNRVKKTEKVFPGRIGKKHDPVKH